METSQNQEQEMSASSFPQYGEPQTDVVYGTPMEEPPVTNGSILKKAIKYFFTYLGLSLFGGLLALPFYACFKLIPWPWNLAGDKFLWIMIGAQLLPLYVFWKKKWCDFSWIKTPHLGKLLSWIVVAWLGYLLIGTCIAEVLSFLGVDTESQDLMEDGGLLLSVISACILAPLNEEGFFRGIFLRKLLTTNWNPWVAIALSALVFAMMHFDPYVSTLTFISGLIMGWIYYRTRNIWLTIFMHVFNNTVSTAMEFLSRYVDDTSMEGEPFYVYLLYLGAGLVLLYVSVRAIDKIVARNERLAALNAGRNSVPAADYGQMDL